LFPSEDVAPWLVAGTIVAVTVWLILVDEVDGGAEVADAAMSEDAKLVGLPPSGNNAPKPGTKVELFASQQFPS